MLPPDVKIVPYYDRTDLIDETTKTVERNLLRGMLLVLVILGIFLFSVRTALIVAVTIPFALLFSFICLDWRAHPGQPAVDRRDRLRHHRRRRGRDGREHLPRAGRAARPEVRPDRA